MLCVVIIGMKKIMKQAPVILTYYKLSSWNFPLWLYVIWSEVFLCQDLESIPEGLAKDEGETLEEIDLTHNRISYPFY